MADQARTPAVAIVDYGMGNLYSVARSCEVAGMTPSLTASPAGLVSADLVILPGVGAFGDAMAALRERGLDEALREVASAGRPLWGICLGLQLLFDVSYEMGEHAGLGLLAGSVERIPQHAVEGRSMPKVPRVGWARVEAPAGRGESGADWAGTPIDAVSAGTWMYFVHSYFVRPTATEVILAESVLTTGSETFRYCSAVRSGSIFATQFHPERSGPDGQRMYHRVAEIMRRGWEQETP